MTHFTTAAILTSPPNGDPRWYAFVHGKSFGPYERPDIQRMIRNQQLHKTDYLYIEGKTDLIEARNDPTFGHLFSDHVDVAAIPPKNRSDIPSVSSTVYRAKSATQWRLAFIAFVLGMIGLFPLKQIAGWLSGGPMPETGAFFAAAAALFFLPIGTKFAANALRGLPRLTVTPEGLKLEGGIRNKSANWGDVGPFAIRNVYSGRSRQVRVTSAKIVGSGMGRARNFAVPDHFTAPIEEITTELNAVRARAIGDTAPAAAEIAPEEAAIGLAHFTLPWLTFTLLAVLIVIFTLENVFPVTPGGKGLTPSIATLVAFGALSHKLMAFYGQWYRLFTAPLLHANLAHIVGNGIALVWGGWLLERLVGRLWFFAFFAVGALGGSLFSLAVNPVNLVSVGASGALMGLFAALFVVSFRHTSGTASRTRLQFSSMRILIPSLLPIASTSAIGHIDFGAHIGGALSGAALALLLLKRWPENARIPQLRGFAASVTSTGALLFVASIGLVIVNYSKFSHALQHAQSPAPSPPADVLSDHGPKRVACDFKWSTLHLRDSAAYQAFLQKCMTENSTTP